MMFIMMTLCFTVAMLLAGGIATYIMLQPKVQNWYTNLVFKQMHKSEQVFYVDNNESK